MSFELFKPHHRSIKRPGLWARRCKKQLYISVELRSKLDRVDLLFDKETGNIGLRTSEQNGYKINAASGMIYAEAFFKFIEMDDSPVFLAHWDAENNLFVLRREE